MIKKSYGFITFYDFLVKETPIEYLYRHAGEYQNLVKAITYWMLVFTSMTKCVLVQIFLSILAINNTRLKLSVYHDCRARPEEPIYTFTFLDK